MVRNTAAAPGVIGIDPEAGQAGDLEREIDFEAFFVGLALGVAHDVVHHGVDILVRHRGDVDPAHVAVDPHHRRHVRGEMKIRRLVLDSESQ
jgi:hypothetical protein